MAALPEIHMPDDSRLPIEDEVVMEPIPRGTSGDMQIVHRLLPAGMPLRYFKDVAVWKHDRTFTVLHQRGQTWMSDTPQETTAMTLASKVARGDVLVTGLGLGVFQRTVPDAVRSVTTLEVNPDVVRLVWRHIVGADKRQRCLLGKAEDTMSAMAREGRTFDFIYLDTWDGGDYEQLPSVNWYVRKAGELLADGGEVRAWTYESMVRSYVEDAIDFRNKVLVHHLDRVTEKRILGMQAMWPMLADFLIWVLEGDHEHAGVPPEAECRRWLEHHARTITMEPAMLFQLSQRRLVEQQAKELVEAHRTTPEDVKAAHEAYAKRVLHEGQRRRPGGDSSPMLCKF